MSLGTPQESNATDLQAAALAKATIAAETAGTEKASKAAASDTARRLSLRLARLAFRYRFRSRSLS